ncbi:MAG: Mur ligase family protein [Candidatus Paceibacterota bacterium]|jgi:UDP-N-acetylmuramate: L-alanyl-gamma-D-glutamyl-meso-diaminopimelate ligase
MASQSQNLPGRVHIIGICGVATSALAIALHNKGVKVTGSDKGFFPPISTELENKGISFYAGWHTEKMIENGNPDIVIVGGSGTSPNNPETINAKELGIPVISFAEALAKYIIKKNSIVVVGTWGKTTSSALLSFILGNTEIKPSYFTGGLSLSHDTGLITDSDWSVVEGDEYQISISDRRPKFDLFSPTHLLLTSVSWDHADLYPTEKDYFNTFEKLVRQIPDSGIVVACIDNAGVNKILANAKTKVITYGENPSSDFRLHSIEHTKKGLRFKIDQQNTSYEIVSPMLGRFNAENITGAFAMAVSIDIDPKEIIKSIGEFKGIKRRFEKRLDGDITVLDCHAPTPEKASSVLTSIREVYDAKIIAVYEPNIGGRQRDSIKAYNNAFKDADSVLIPRLTKLKVDPTNPNKPLEGEELASTMSYTHANTKYIDDDEILIQSLKSQSEKGDVIVFLGSHGFRGMIETIVKILSN